MGGGGGDERRWCESRRARRRPPHAPRGDAPHACAGLAAAPHHRHPRAASLPPPSRHAGQTDISQPGRQIQPGKRSGDDRGGSATAPEGTPSAHRLPRLRGCVAVGEGLLPPSFRHRLRRELGAARWEEERTRHSVLLRVACTRATRGRADQNLTLLDFLSLI